ncbi:MAG: hypothetical protein VKK42_01345 [Lyngbya sp.]|nr:hypothetical protein [Lyngbya sp.]
MFKRLSLFPLVAVGLAVSLGVVAIQKANSQNQTDSNIFDPVEIYQKKRFIGLDVVKVDLHPFGENRWVGEVTFDGEVTVSGTYNPNTLIGESQQGSPCFFVDERTENKLPRLKGDERFMWFCFNNPQDILRSLGTVEKSVEIVIDDYKTIYIPSDVTNTATFVRSVSQ